MAIRRISGCRDCGSSPCMRCTDIQNVCDNCEADVDNVYDLNGDELCWKCYYEGMIGEAINCGAGECCSCGAEVKNTFAFPDEETEAFCSHCYKDLISENAYPIRR